MTTFFQPSEARDQAYCNTRDGTEDRHVRGRQNIERIWQNCAQYVDSDAAVKAMRDFPSVFWELHLANALCHAGKGLVPRAQLGYLKNKGPDLFAKETPGVWIEAIAVQPGNGADKLEPADMDKVYSHNPDGVVLRLRSAISFKSTKLRSYIDGGIIKPGQATIIAISGIALPYRYSGITPPEIIRAVYPVNNPVLEINRLTGAVMDRYVEHRAQLKKARGADVATDVFLNPDHSHISAVLFDDSDWVHYPDPPGANAKLVHNAGAEVPLPDGWFPEGDEYWWRDGAVRNIRHLPPPSETARPGPSR